MDDVGKGRGPGRPPGALNKTTTDIKVLAQSFGPSAILRLAELSGFLPDPEDATGKTRLKGAESEPAQIAACKELLDRGYGRAVQALQNLDKEGNPTDAPMRVVVEFLGDAAPVQREQRDMVTGARLAGGVEFVG